MEVNATSQGSTQPLETRKCKEMNSLLALPEQQSSDFSFIKPVLDFWPQKLKIIICWQMVSYTYEPSNSTKSSWHPNLGLQPRELQEINFCLQTTLSVLFCYSNPNGLTQHILRKNSNCWVDKISSSVWMEFSDFDLLKVDDFVVFECQALL